MSEWRTVWWCPLLKSKTTWWEVGMFTSSYGTIFVWRWQHDKMQKLERLCQ